MNLEKVRSEIFKDFGFEELNSGVFSGEWVRIHQERELNL